MSDREQPFFEFYASTDVAGLFVCSLCGCLVKNGPTHTAWHLSAALGSASTLRAALGDLVKEMDHLENHGGIGSHKPVLDRARQALTSSEKEKVDG